MPTTATARETVVLLHGVALHRLFMLRFEHTLTNAGYNVINVTSPSRCTEVRVLADEWLPHLLEERNVASAPRVHFVAHSMGGLIARRYLARQPPANLGHVVLIAVPNRGSALADHFGHVRLLRWIIGVNLSRLGCGSEAFCRELPELVSYPVGTIAGTRPLSPLGKGRLSEPHDGTVAADSTHVPGELDCCKLPYSHTGLLFRRATAQQTLAFLRTGKFLKPAPKP